MTLSSTKASTPHSVFALLSVSDKTGILEFAQGLVRQGITILSTGGTARYLSDAGVPVQEVADYTHFPEILDGRVKTLHPKVHGGILARRDVTEHLQTLEEHGIERIDIVAVNLYPFEKTVTQANCSYELAIENIDIGGPTMVRAAAKNHGSEVGGVTIITDPTDYPVVLKALETSGQVSFPLRRELATKAFAHTAAYDGYITNYLSRITDVPSMQAPPTQNDFPHTYHVSMEKVQDLRYGENPQQKAAFYKEKNAPAGLIAHYQQLQGKELSYNNIADADAAWECVRALQDNSCVIIKHANPCGAASAKTPLEAYRKAFSTDPTSAFGGIIAFNCPVDQATAEAIQQQFVEVVLAPSFEAAALAVFAQKTNVRLLQIPYHPEHCNALEVKRVGGGFLVQSADAIHYDPNTLQVVTQKAPSAQEMQDLLFAWNVAKFVKSNAIIFVKDQMTVGVGAGQMSRVDSARIAAIKAQNAQLTLTNSAVASDAFFPFRDGLDVVVDAGATCVIQPGGSMRDQEVIDAANERGIAMVFTGIRHFRH